ncbi:MAG: hypothetical protein QXQ18_01890 [Candidatus Aenigmatarchaeota archaeon]
MAKIREKKKVVFFLLDGLADIPIKNKTPLSEAKKPNIDFFAKNGVVGELNLVPKKFWQEHAASISPFATISLLGYDLKKFEKLRRGPLEAVGVDIPYKEGYLAIRCNFATVDTEMKVVDRRAGRSSYKLEEIARYINEHVDIGVPYTFMRVYGHRAVLIIKEKLNDNISSNDPMKTGERVKRIHALKAEAELSAKLVQEFIDKVFNVIEFHPANAERLAQNLPPANYILVREGGNVLLDLMPHFDKKWKVKPICITEPGAVRAVFMLSGFNSIKVPELDFESKLNYIFESIHEVLTEYDLVIVHLKDTDEAGHDGDFERKKEMIEEIDSWLADFKSFDGILVITTDHITSTEKKMHIQGNVPVLVYGKGKDNVGKFDEMSVKKGKLKNYNGKKLWKYIFGK